MEARDLLVDHELRIGQRGSHIRSDVKQIHGQLRDLRDILMDTGQQRIGAVEAAQLIPVSGVILAVEHLLRLAALDKHPRVVHAVNPQLVHVVQHGIHPLVLIIYPLRQIPAVNGDLLRLEEEVEPDAPLLTIFLKLGHHLGIGPVVIAIGDIVVHIEEDIPVLPIGVGGMGQLMKQLIVQLGIGPDHQVPSADAVADIVLHSLTEVPFSQHRELRQAAVVNLRHHVGAEVRQAQGDQQHQQKGGAKQDIPDFFHMLLLSHRQNWKYRKGL